MSPATGSRPKTIWLPRILGVVASFSDTPSITALRLTNRMGDESASPWLFRSLKMSLRKKRFTRLDNIAYSEKFATTVHGIVWETAHYRDERDDVPLDQSIFDKDAKPRLELEFTHRERYEKGLVMGRYNALAEEERDLCDLDRQFIWIDKLKAAFTRMTSLESFDLIAWDRELAPEGTVYERDDFRAPWYEPPPLKALKQSGEKHLFRQLRTFCIVLQALQATGRRLAHFGTRSAFPDVCRQMAKETLLPPFMGLNFSAINTDLLPSMSSALRSLRRLHLRFNGPRAVLKRYIAENDNLSVIMESMVQLQDFRLEITGPETWHPAHKAPWHVLILQLSDIFGDMYFPCLTRVALHGFWLEDVDLCNFIFMHDETLRELRFENMQLGETKRARRSSMGLGVVYRPPPPEDLTVASKQWDNVARYCKDLPKLRSLYVAGCSFGAEGNPLGKKGDARVMRIGRKRRVSADGMLGIFK